MLIQLTYLICCIILLWTLIKQQYVKKSEDVPQLSGQLPLLGHALRLIGDRLKGFQNVQSISKECMEKGGIATMYVGFRRIYVLTNPEECIKVSNLCLNKDIFYDIAKPLLGNGLNITEAFKWKRNRKILNSALCSQTINGYLYIFNNQSRKLVDMFYQNVGKGEFDHDDYLKRINLETICITSFGINVEKYGELHKKFLHATVEILNVFYERFSKFWLHNDFIYNMTKLKARQDQYLSDIEKFTKKIYEERKLEIINRSLDLNDENESKNNQEKFQPFMDIIVKMALDTGCFSNQDILYETNNLVFAGFDTSSTVLTFILTLLGSHSDVQNKVYDEIQEVIGNTQRDVNIDDLPKLVYMEAVIKETLRLYPLAALVARHIDRDVHLKNYTLKADSGCFLLYWGLHRHPLWGPDAEVFRPERWIETSLPNVSTTFAGFSMGRRNCIGKIYAMMSMKTTLTHIIQNFKISSNIRNMQLKMDVLLRPHSGYEITIEKRLNNH